MTDFIEIYDDALSSDDCDYTVEMIDKLPKRRVNENQKHGTRHKKDVYYVEDTFLVEPSPHAVAINNALNRCINKYVEKHHQLKRTDASWQVDNSYCLQKYDPNMGYFVSHAENQGYCHHSIRRMLVWMIYLNTVTDDGGTYFENYDKTINAVRGRCVIWPAFWTHFHNGIVSKTQTKYIATGWFMYDRIPDSRDKTSKGSLFADLFQNPYNLTDSV